MNYKQWREETIGELMAAGFPYYKAAKLMALSNRHGRLAVAQCNGEWPAQTQWTDSKDCGECPKCGNWWQKNAIKKSGCPDCRVESAILALAGDQKIIEGFSFAGDPRGCTVTAIMRTGERVAIPQREY